MNSTPLLKSKTFSKICRTCLQSQDLFFIDNVHWEGISLRKVLGNWLSFENNYENKMPQNICKSCAKYIYNIHYFLLQTERNNEILQNSLVNELSTFLIKEAMTINKPEEPMIIIEVEGESNNTDFVEHSYNVTLTQDQSTSSNLLKFENNIASSGDLDSNLQTTTTLALKASESLLTKTSVEDKSEIFINEINKDKAEIQSIIKTAYNVNNLQKMQMEWKHLEQTGQIVSELDKDFIYFCGSCEVGFYTYDDLLLHKKVSTHYKGCIFVCPHCKKKTTNHQRFNIHMAIHANQKPCVCPTCGKRFTAKGDLSRHVKYIHLKQKKLKCKFCYRIFSKEEDLNEHEQTHENFNYICSFCGKSFKVFDRWYQHERIHKQNTFRNKTNFLMKVTEEGTFLCNECGEVFLNKQSFMNHMENHKNLMFSCDICKKEFSSELKMKSHKNFVHSVEKFVCDICGHTVKQKKNLKEHIEKIHEGKKNTFKINCDYCDKVFFCKSSHREHLRIHNNDTKYQCEVCHKICTTARNLKTHMRVHTGERSHECKHCGKKFAAETNLKYHLRTHAGPPTFQCPLCIRAFYRNYQLQRHIKKLHNTNECNENGLQDWQQNNDLLNESSDETPDTDQDELVSDNQEILNLVFIDN